MYGYFLTIVLSNLACTINCFTLSSEITRTSHSIFLFHFPLLTIMDYMNVLSHIYLLSVFMTTYLKSSLYIITNYWGIHLNYSPPIHIQYQQQISLQQTSHHHYL